MKVLITTVHFLLKYDLDTDDIEVLESGYGEYYGMTWNPTGDIFALSYSGIDNSSLINLDAYVNSERGYLSIGGMKTWEMFSATHQILWVDDNTILITNTGRNALTKYFIDTGSKIDFRFNDILWDRLTPSGKEGFHFNSIFYRDEKVYLLAHNYDKGSFVLELSWPSLSVINKYAIDANGIHNFCILNDDLWITCESNQGRLVEAKSGKVLWDNHQAGYVRGLAISEDKIIIGDSLVTGNRNSRENSETGLWVLDRETFETENYIPLGYFGAVHDVRIIDEIDFCHNGTVLNPNALDFLGKSKKTIQEEKLFSLVKPYLSSKNWSFINNKSLSINQFGVIYTDPNTFSLAIKKDEKFIDGSISATIMIRGFDIKDHVSLVARYNGPDDNNMYAALFQQNNKHEIVVTIWVNGMDKWMPINSNVIPNNLITTTSSEEMEFAPKFELSGSELKIIIGNSVVLNVNDDKIQGLGSYGIRILGSTFGIKDLIFSKK